MLFIPLRFHRKFLIYNLFSITRNCTFSQNVCRSYAVENKFPSNRSRVIIPRFFSNQQDSVYEKECEETLEKLSEFFEELVESHKDFSDGDVSFSDGVLTVNLGKKHGTYVINRQSPNRQIWLSSPISGPKRYDYESTGKWIYKHDNRTLISLLQEEISNMLDGKKIEITQFK